MNSLPASAFASLPKLLLTDVLGLGIFAAGLAFEVVADRQKARWVEEKKRKEHDEEFLTRGLWSRSRHPNYFGESTLWTGIAIAASGVLASKAGVGAIGFGTTGVGLGFGRAVALGMCAVSPAFVTFLLLKVSGVPLSERKYDKRYGADERYRRWKAETPVFVPKLF
jgi:steroid 5-alpha reductase family enzyme